MTLSAVILIEFSFTDSIWATAPASELEPSEILILFVGAFSISSSLEAFPTLAGVHQKLGYRRWMLLMTSDVISTKVALSSTKGSRYHPRLSTCVSTAASKAVAPAGGYTVFVTVIAADATPHANAPASHLRFSKSALSLKSFVMPMPTTADITCPIIAFRGWARGDSIVLNSKMAAAPCIYQRQLEHNT